MSFIGVGLAAVKKNITAGRSSVDHLFLLHGTLSIKVSLGLGAYKSKKKNKAEKNIIGALFSIC